MGKHEIYFTKLALKLGLPADFVKYTYNLWQHIKQKCYNENYHETEYYKGRGIEIFDGWYDDYESFARYIWENLGERPEGYSLDRINNDGNYEPRNIRWATKTEQSINRRSIDSRLKLKHISLRANSYRVQICRNYHVVFFKSCKTLEEAIEIRDKFLTEENYNERV
jgi:hypothetical protein